VETTASVLRRKAEYEATRPLRDVRLFLRLLGEHGGSRFFRNVGIQPQDYTVSQPTSPSSRCCYFLLILYFYVSMWFDSHFFGPLRAEAVVEWEHV
jgi:hypothetical protein